MWRSALAVLTGLAVTIIAVMILTPLAGVLTGVAVDAPPTPSYLVINLIGSALAGIAGGAITMRLAPRVPHGHVAALAFAILLLSLPILLAEPAPGQPAWYPVAISLLGPLSVLLGGLLGVRWRRM